MKLKLLKAQTHGRALSNAALHRYLRPVGVRDLPDQRETQTATAAFFAAGFVHHVKGLEYAGECLLRNAAPIIRYLYRAARNGEADLSVFHASIVGLCSIVHKIDEQGLDQVRVDQQRSSVRQGVQRHAPVGKAFLRVLPYPVK